MACSCASKRVVWMTRLPSLSLLSKSTFRDPSALISSVGGAMVTASRRKLPMFAPNLKMAASAASSAFSRSFSRFVASLRKREITPSESRRASLLERSLLSPSSLCASPDSAAVGVAGGDWPVDIDRARLTMVVLRSVKPLSASPPAAVASWRAPS